MQHEACMKAAASRAPHTCVRIPTSGQLARRPRQATERAHTAYYSQRYQHRSAAAPNFSLRASRSRIRWGGGGGGQGGGVVGGGTGEPGGGAHFPCTRGGGG
eukprot:COSAG01_NODE_9372_length_2464_cov_5.895560_1_plen_101_part_10